MKRGDWKRIRAGDLKEARTETQDQFWGREDAVGDSDTSMSMLIPVLVE